MLAGGFLWVHLMAAFSLRLPIPVSVPVQLLVPVIAFVYVVIIPDFLLSAVDS